MAARLKLHIEFVEQDVRQDGADGAALRRPDLPLLDHSVFGYGGSEHLVHELDDASILDALRQDLKKLAVVNGIKELSEVDVHYPYVSVIGVRQCLVNGRRTAPLRAEAVAPVTKYGLVLRAQHLSYRLLHEPVDHGWNSERSLLSVLLGDVYATNGRRLIPSRFDVFNQIGPVQLQVIEQIPDLHAVDTGATLVPDYGLVGLVQVVAGKYGLQIDHLVRPCLVMLLPCSPQVLHRACRILSIPSILFGAASPRRLSRL